jgi:hypothetical protein
MIRSIEQKLSEERGIMPQRDGRVKEILDRISLLFGDTSVGRLVTLLWMEEIQEAVNLNIQILTDQMEQDGDLSS